MAELNGIPLATHLEAITREWASRNSIYGYPSERIWRGFDDLDLSVPFHEKTAATPLGPASGPHTQLAQNIVLAFLAGGRIMELKTVQIQDRLEIPRPCIDARNVGYNVEWSQELRLSESLDEYVTAWILLKLIEEMELLGVPKGDPFYRTVFDISVGYDLAGISTPEIGAWLRTLRDAGERIEALMETLPGAFRHLADTPIDPHISDSVTLSTFHGCPRDEIEAIVEHLIAEHGFHVIVKLNPTLMGYDTVRELLVERMGYGHIELDPEAFAHDLQFDEGVAMIKRLETFAARHGKRVGAKFTNTLVVKNSARDVFQDPVMYLSGPPLHVLSLTTMHRFREAVGRHLPVSFSAGIDRRNVAEAVSCNMVPVTTCTDLLKTGGYRRMAIYLDELAGAMRAAEAATVAEFIRARGNSDNLGDAGATNAERLVAALPDDPRYHAANNRKAPRKIDSHLTLFDCITCDKCLPVCPNAANIALPATPGETAMPLLQRSNGGMTAGDGGTFVLEKDRQIANLADFCNECGDCDTYCPEHGGPYIEKPRIFHNAERYRQFADYDGFCRMDDGALLGRISGVEHVLRLDADADCYLWTSPELSARFSRAGEWLAGEWHDGVPADATVSSEPFFILKTIFEGLAAAGEDYPAVVVGWGRE